MKTKNSHFVLNEIDLYFTRKRMHDTLPTLLSEY